MKPNCNSYDRWTVDLARGRVPGNVNATPKSELRLLRSLRVFLFPLLAMFLAFGLTVSAQTFRGTILGTVTDSSGASVAGATVIIKNTDTGLTRTVTTSDDGSYSVPELPIGNYSVTVEKSGFKTAVIKGIRVEVSGERRADVTLQAGQVAETVKVSGDLLPQR